MLGLFLAGEERGGLGGAGLVADVAVRGGEALEQGHEDFSLATFSSVPAPVTGRKRPFWYRSTMVSASGP